MSASLLDITQEDHGPVTVLRVRGEIDLATAGSFGDALSGALGRAAAGAGAAVVVDLGAVAFLGSHGLRELEVARMAAHYADKRLVLADLARPVSRVLALTGLTGQFTVYPSVDEALAAVASPA